MKILWYIAKKDLLQVLKDRSSFLLLLVVPLALIAVIGAAFGGFTNSSSQIAITVAINNQDNGYVGKAVVDALKIDKSNLKITVNAYNSADKVTQQVKDSNVDAGVVIPAGTTDTLIKTSVSTKTTENLVKVYSLPNSSDARVAIVQNLVSSIVNQLVSAQYAGSSAVSQVYKVCNVPGNHCSQQTIDTATIAKNVGNASAVAAQNAQVQSLPAGQAPKTNTFDQTVPGYAVFFALFGLNAVAATILQEKEDGTFRRLLIAPIQKYSLLGGKVLAQFILTLLQLAVLFTIGNLVFHLDVASWPALILLLIGTSFATTGLGILLVSVVKTRRQLNPIVTLVTLITAAIGGAWWPLFLEPTWMQQIAKIGITAWAMEGLNAIMIYGKGFESAVPDIIGLLGYGVICFLIALRFFRFQEKAA